MSPFATARLSLQNTAGFTVLSYSEQNNILAIVEALEREIETGQFVDSASHRMFLARLENMVENKHQWITVQDVLALLSDCDMLAQRETPDSGNVETLRPLFEKGRNDSHGFRRSRRGFYVNPQISRDWRAFCDGVRAAKSYSDSTAPDDAERYRWMVEDHPTQETRAKVYEVAKMLNTRGKGHIDAAIDAARGSK